MSEIIGYDGTLNAARQNLYSQHCALVRARQNALQYDTHWNEVGVKCAERSYLDALDLLWGVQQRYEIMGTPNVPSRQYPGDLDFGSY